MARVRAAITSAHRSAGLGIDDGRDRTDGFHGPRGRGSPRGRSSGDSPAIVLIADQLTKAWVDASFALASPFAAPRDRRSAPTPSLGDLVRIAKTYNDGGIFGLAGDSALLLAAASMVVIAIIVARAGAPGPRRPAAHRGARAAARRRAGQPRGPAPLRRT